MKKTTINEVTLYPLRPTNKGLICFASCLLDNKLSLNSIAVYTRPDGSDYRILFPSKTLPNGKQVELFYPKIQKDYQVMFIIYSMVVKMVQFID